MFNRVDFFRAAGKFKVFYTQDGRLCQKVVTDCRCASDAIAHTRAIRPNGRGFMARALMVQPDPEEPIYY